MTRKLVVSVLVLISVLSAAALACSSVSVPGLFATPTPTPTMTFTPTITPSPTPTSTPSPTPKPTGMIINKVPGGGNEFVDYDAGYSIDVPARWSIMRLDKEDLQAALDTAGERNPQMKEMLQAAQNAPAGTFRLIGFDQGPLASGFAVNFNVIMSQGEMAAKLPLDMLIQAGLEQLKTQASVKATQLETKKNANNVPIGGMELRMTMQTPAGVAVKLLERQHYFQTDKGLVVITFSAPVSSASDYFAAYDEVLDGIQLLGE